MVIWIISIALGVVPSILSGRNFKFYDNSHVCIGLPLALTKAYTRTFQSYQALNIIQTPTLGGDQPELPGAGGMLFGESTTIFKGYTDGLYYSTALFLCLNGFCYMIILGCYVEIFRAHSKSAKQSGRTPAADEQMRLTRKVFAIVATDFCCVFPIICLGILVQTRAIVLPASVFAWSVTFILPINSAINPYLYTIAEIISRKHTK